MSVTPETGPAEPRELHHLDVRLGYADCDPAQILYFAAWFPWMERTQTEWLYLHGLRPDELRERFGFRIISRAAACEYLVPARLFDRIRVSLHVDRIGTTSLRWGFRMVREGDGALVARASLTTVSIGDDGRPIPLPDAMRSAVGAGSAS